MDCCTYAAYIKPNCLNKNLKEEQEDIENVDPNIF